MTAHEECQVEVNSSLMTRFDSTYLFIIRERERYEEIIITEN